MALCRELSCIPPLRFVPHNRMSESSHDWSCHGTQGQSGGAHPTLSQSTAGVCGVASLMDDDAGRGLCATAVGLSASISSLSGRHGLGRGTPGPASFALLISSIASIRLSSRLFLQRQARSEIALELRGWQSSNAACPRIKAVNSDWERRGCERTKFFTSDRSHGASGGGSSNVDTGTTTNKVAHRNHAVARSIKQDVLFDAALFCRAPPGAIRRKGF